MTPILSMLLTVAVIVFGTVAVMYTLRFFPIIKAGEEQYEFDLDVAPDFLKRTRASAHEANRSADVIREEVQRLKNKPPIR